MSRHETTRRQRCDRCWKVTLHGVIQIAGEKHQVTWCTECDE